ncbi:hypothetical protein BDZ45DRAFT_679132 [Acephala macrosclerotiorum]|nr:hypothetical protein BDZ45DRAFT_679132 [Acephala macrosclerotiorum]
MYTSSIITAFASILALTSAAPAPGRTLSARSAPVVDVLVQSSLLNAANVNAHAIQVVLGEIKVCLGDAGFPPCQLSKMSISPFGNTTDITKVECQGFTDTKATVPASGIFTSAYPAILSSTSTVAVGSVLCDFI